MGDDGDVLAGEVALLAEGVDRNHVTAYEGEPGYTVALLAEGVDRNSRRARRCYSRDVALLAEGVDRNQP